MRSWDDVTAGELFEADKCGMLDDRARLAKFLNVPEDEVVAELPPLRQGFRALCRAVERHRQARLKARRLS